jgi:hypothetical protein
LRFLENIIIEEPELKGNRLSSKVSVPNSFEKYLKEKELFIEYNTEINADEDILNIPLTATILPLAWLTGVNVNVGKIDRTFKESMDSLQKEFTKTYPLIKFSTEIIADKLIENKIGKIDQEKRTGLLFSGGVDSFYSLINNLQKKPKLIILWGSDNFPYPEHSDHWEKTISIYQDFAERKKLELNVLKTNISQILDGLKITHKFHKELYNGGVRSALQHSLVLIPATAPLSIGRFNKIIIAASGSPPYNTLKPRAARPWFDEKIIWADLKVETHGCIPRKDKIFSLAEYMKEDNITLRVCLSSKLVDGLINDCSCPKCYLQIAHLIIAGADPNECGFKVEESTFARMKAFLISKKSLRLNQKWYEIQKIARNGVDFEVPGSREFFKWLQDFDLRSGEINWFYTDLYMSLPYVLAKNLDRVYYRMGINIHEEPYIREEIQTN